jgi:hypothetical protein
LELVIKVFVLSIFLFVSTLVFSSDFVLFEYKKGVVASDFVQLPKCTDNGENVTCTSSGNSYYFCVSLDDSINLVYGNTEKAEKAGYSFNNHVLQKCLQLANKWNLKGVTPDTDTDGVPYKN